MYRDIALLLSGILVGMLVTHWAHMKSAEHLRRLAAKTRHPSHGTFREPSVRVMRDLDVPLPPNMPHRRA